MAGLCEGGNEPSGSLKAICNEASVFAARCAPPDTSAALFSSVGVPRADKPLEIDTSSSQWLPFRHCPGSMLLRAVTLKFEQLEKLRKSREQRVIRTSLRLVEQLVEQQSLVHAQCLCTKYTPGKVTEIMEDNQHI
ncbi:hypothetical protein ANN_17920 [Periplaneta americana]|uniref:Uncharacterized protein n=1 Tax=Periplaneta americana TaxID=6978 RepID=A0ABQ8SMC6_PERAM|nr:hypothetical protein ANN_17920 [Periplaneta americana]